MSKYLVSRPGPLLTPVLFLSAHPSATLPAPLQLAYCVVQFLEKESSLTEPVTIPLGPGSTSPRHRSLPVGSF